MRHLDSSLQAHCRFFGLSFVLSYKVVIFVNMEQKQLYNNAMFFQPLSAGGEACTVYEFRGPETQYVAIRNQGDTFFAGHTTKGVLSSWIMGDIPQRVIELAVNAINNRTRERNFFRLGEQLALGEISEEEYDRTLDQQEDEYVIKCNIKPSEMDMKVAAHLAPKVMDVENIDDLAVLFSFDETVIRHYLEEWDD